MERVEVRRRVLSGGTGFVAMWCACTLHGAWSDAADPRIPFADLDCDGSAAIGDTGNPA
jgi:hypothetical protein